MKDFKVMVNGKVSVVKDMEWAKEIARKASLVNFRAVVKDGNEIVARYEWGKEI